MIKTQGTIRNADLIYCLDKGQIAESGTHDELMKKKGLYYSLVINQETGDDSDSKNKISKSIKSLIIDFIWSILSYDSKFKLKES